MPCLHEYEIYFCLNALLLSFFPMFSLLALVYPCRICPPIFFLIALLVDSWLLYIAYILVSVHLS